MHLMSVLLSQQCVAHRRRGSVKVIEQRLGNHGLPFFCSFIAAILAFRSSRRLAISLSFSSLLMLARLGVATGGGGEGAAGMSSGTSSQVASTATGATGTTGFEDGLGEETGVALFEMVLVVVVELALEASVLPFG